MNASDLARLRGSALTSSVSGRASPRWGLLEWFVIGQLVLPALMFLPGTQPWRLPIRTAAFAVSLMALALWFEKSTRTPRHPAQTWLVCITVYLALMLFHPTTNSLLAGVAQIGLYAAVFAPVFWVPPLIRGPEHLSRLLLIFLICNGLNAAVGVLQVYDPDTWMPAEFSSRVLASEYGLDAVSYIGPDGQQIVRPPGLFDNPGAVAGPGMMASALGVMFVVAPVSFKLRVISMAFAILGVAAIYLSHVRTSLLIVIGVSGVYFTAMWFLARRQKMRGLVFLAIAGIIGVLAFSLSLTLGGEATRARFETLVASTLVDVYYDSQRGPMLESAFSYLLVEFPFGAGLGRWGMIHAHFGDPSNLDSSEIWAELQPNAWIVDGGLLLLVFYSTALVVTVRSNIRIARRIRDPQLRNWSIAVLAVSTGIVALGLGFTPFTTQIGLQYWFLVGALQGAVVHSEGRDGVHASVRGR